eukprot:148282_1
MAICMAMIGIIKSFLAEGPGTDKVLFVGIAAPRSIGLNVDDVTFLGLPWNMHNATISDRLSATYNLFKIIYYMSYSKVSVKDARRNTNLSFSETGFMLIDNQQIVDTLDANEYENHMKNVISSLFPNAKRIEVMKSVIRGLSDNAPPIPIVHFDIAPNRQLAAGLYPEFADIMGSESTTYLVLGTWTPMHMNDTVCTDSLALLDTSSTLKQDVMLFQENYNTKLTNGEIDLRKLILDWKYSWHMSFKDVI